MGILDAIWGSIDGALADSWLEVITCNEYRQGQLMAEGFVLRGTRSSNTKATPGVYTDGSKVFVGYKETALFIENGKIISVFDTPGSHEIHSELTKGFFSGKSVKEGLKNINEDAKERFTYGGDKAVSHRVLYINQREIMGNEYELEGLPVRITVPGIDCDVDCSVNLAGMYSFRIKDAVAYYKNFNYATSDPIAGLIDSILLTTLQPAIAKLFAKGVRPSGMVEYVEQLSTAICEEITEKLGPERGIELVSCGIASFVMKGKDLHMIQELERDKVLTDPAMAGAHLVGAMADAMQSIAYYANGAGGLWGYTRIGAELLKQREEQGIKKPEPEKARLWKCHCGEWVRGKFCTHCGQKELFECRQCGAEVTGNFCTSCGAKINRK